MDLGAGGERSFWNGSSEFACEPAVAPPFGTAPFLNFALSSAGVGTWQFDKATGQWATDAMASGLLGLDPVPCADISAANILAEDRSRLRRDVEIAISDGTPYEIEFRVRRDTGEIRWIHGLSRKTPDTGDEGRYLAGIIYDITEHKLAQSTLLERERQQSAIVASLPGIAYRCGLAPPWRMNFIGGAVEQLTGRDPDDFLAHRIDWSAVVHPQDLPMVAERVATAVGNRTRFDIRYRIVHADGEARWVHERGRAAYSQDGAPLFLEGFIGDIHEQAIAENRLRETEERYRLVSQAAMEVIWDLDLATNEITFNDAISAVFRHDIANINTTSEWWRDQVHPDDYQRVSQALAALIQGKDERYSGEHRFRRGDGTYAEIYTRCQVMRDDAGRPIRLLGSLMDLSDLKLSDAALRESEAINRSIVEASIECVMLFDLDGNLRFMNASGAQGMEMDDVSVLYGRPWPSLWPVETQPIVAKAIATARNGGVGRFTAAGQSSRGTTKWGEVVVAPVLDDLGKPVKLVAFSRDITARREAEDRLLWNATRDPLTSLPNRALFQRTLNEAVARAGATQGKVGLLVLDLDHFKQINDTLGHDAGDALLKTVASRLEAFCAADCRGTALASRLGGDEFALIIEDTAGESDVGLRAAALLAQLRAPVVHAGRLLDCNVTIGAALFPDHGEKPEDLLKSADIALYAAKASSRGRAVTFEPGHRTELQARQSMIRRARKALDEKRILPFYQPKVRLDSGAIYGFEALLRWRHERDGIQLPATISAAFENLELAAAISDRIVDQVIVDMRGWLDRGLSFGHVAVNAAAAEFRSDRFAESVLERLEKAGVPPRYFHLEVTETVFLGRGAEYVERALKLMSEAGISIALDDFGTGYASLRHLKQFPVNVIKIDRSFVQNMETDPDDAAIIEAVLNLGKSLKIEVVAEGIETVSHAARLKQMHCDYGQGFLFSPAVAARQVPALVRSLGAPRKRRRAA